MSWLSFMQITGSFSFVAEASKEYKLGFKLNLINLSQVEGTHLQIKDAHFLLGDGQSHNAMFNFVETIKVKELGEHCLYNGPTQIVQWEAYEGATLYSISLQPVYDDFIPAGEPQYTFLPEINLKDLPFVYSRVLLEMKKVSYLNVF